MCHTYWEVKHVNMLMNATTKPAKKSLLKCYKYPLDSPKDILSFLRPSISTSQAKGKQLKKENPQHASCTLHSE